MRTLRRFLLLLVLLAAMLGGGAYYFAADAPGPTIAVTSPTTAIGLENRLEMSVESPDGALNRVEAFLVQGNQRFPLFSLDRPEEATLTQETAERVRITRAFGRRTFPALNPGQAQLVVVAARPVLFGVREAESTVRLDLRLIFELPRLRVVSTQPLRQSRRRRDGGISCDAAGRPTAVSVSGTGRIAATRHRAQV